MGAAFHSDTIFAKGRGESERRSDTLFGLPKNCERKRETEGRGGSAILSNTYTHSNGDGPSKKLHGRVPR